MVRHPIVRRACALTRLSDGRISFCLDVFSTDAAGSLFTAKSKLMDDRRTLQDYGAQLGSAPFELMVAQPGPHVWKPPVTTPFLRSIELITPFRHPAIGKPTPTPSSPA